MKAAIIAGGRGTRIRSVTGGEIPKAMISIAGKPLIVRQLALLERYGICEVAVLAGHLADVLKNCIARSSLNQKIKIEVYTEKTPRGTAGGLKAVEGYFDKEEPFLILYGDMMLEMDLHRLEQFHRQYGALATVVAQPNDHPQKSDLIRTNGGVRILEILSYQNRQPGNYPNLVPSGVYCCSPQVMKFINGTIPEDFIHDIFPRLLKKGMPLAVYNTPEYLRDIGTPDRYKKVVKNVREGFLPQFNRSSSRPVVFFDRDGVINEFVPGKGVTNSSQLRLIESAPEAIRLANQAGWLTVSITNQPQLAKGFINQTALNSIHAKLETELGNKGAWLDRIYFCPHHPDRGYKGEVELLKFNCDCRKPRPGLIQQAMKELPIDASRAFVIGDSWRDVGAARHLNLPVCGVRTGLGCRDCDQFHSPDLIFDDILDAVHFLIKGIPEADKIIASFLPTLQHRKKAIVLSVCGLARSGKSSFTQALSICLKKRGISVLNVHLDDWILPASKRNAQSNAEERLAVSQYPDLLRKLLRGETLQTPRYDPKTREKSGTVAYRLTHEKVVILDGIFAGGAKIRPFIDKCFYVRARTKTLEKRFKSFYQWKGISTEKTDRLLETRKKEEWPAVILQMSTADYVIHFSNMEAK